MDGKKVYVFQSSIKPLFAVSLDMTGCNIPPPGHGAVWLLCGVLRSVVLAQMPITAEQLRTHGYFIFEGGAAPTDMPH